MKTMFLLVEGFDTPGPSNHLIQTLVEDTLSAGIDVFMIQSYRKGIHEELPDNLKGKENLEYTCVNRKVIKKSSFVHRYLEEAAYAFRCMRIWRKRKDIDLVFVQSCPTVVFPILLLKYFMKKPVIYSVQDVFPGSAINSGVMKSRFLAAVFKKIQKIAYRNSDKITVISEDMKQVLIKEGVSCEKIVPIVNWYDDTSVHEVPHQENRFIKKYALAPGNFYVQYAGTMGYVFDYPTVLEAAKLLRDHGDIKFQMIGNGSQKEAFMKQASDMYLDNIEFYPLEPLSMVSDVYSACDICLIPLKKGIIGNSVPSKAGLLMACNRMIINSVDKGSDYYRMFHDNEIGISVDNDDPKAVAAAILDCYRDRDMMKKRASKGHEFGKRYYARSTNTKKFIELFNDVYAGDVL